MEETRTVGWCLVVGLEVSLILGERRAGCETWRYGLIQARGTARMAGLHMHSDFEEKKIDVAKNMNISLTFFALSSRRSDTLVMS